jgi:hypothetical protein
MDADNTRPIVGFHDNIRLVLHSHDTRPRFFLRFIPIGVFDDATVRTIGRAFDAACKELKDTGQPDVVHEVMIKRIIAAARKGERNVTRLRDAALTGLRKPRNEIRG